MLTFVRYFVPEVSAIIWVLFWWLWPKPMIFLENADIIELETSFWLFKYIVRKMTVICGSSYIARYDERIRVNGQNNDRCEADRE